MYHGLALLNSRHAVSKFLILLIHTVTVILDFSPVIVERGRQLMIDQGFGSRQVAEPVHTLVLKLIDFKGLGDLDGRCVRSSRSIL
jgi:hypothetical protein